MKQTKKLYIVILLLMIGCIPISASNTETMPNGGLNVDDKYFANQNQLFDFFKKLSNMLDKKVGKINIVHIGDSHIQAGFITAPIRNSFQNTFGDGGIGFSFPYELVKTNGPRDAKYITNIAWSSWPNTRAISDMQIGLGGYGLSTQSKEFVLQLTTEDTEFNKIKVIYPSQKPQFKLSVLAKPLEIESTVEAKGKTHKIRKGESLSAISRKYGVSVAKIKSANKMKNDVIHPNKTLKIPTQNTVRISNIKIDDNIEFAGTEDKPYYSTYTSKDPLQRITFFPQQGLSKYTINGFVIENKYPGVIYHSIGINGAHISDYNKYPLFFDQLPILEPDLIIISLGTNESFGRMSADEFMYQMNNFVAKLKSTNKKATVLVMTPPPSMFRRNRENIYVSDYTTALTQQTKYPVWDLYRHMDGSAGIKTGRFAAMIARDKVHYTKNGYELQGYMFATDFINAYNKFIERRTK